MQDAQNQVPADAAVVHIDDVTDAADAGPSMIGSVQLFQLKNMQAVVAKVTGIDFENGVYHIARPAEYKVVMTKEGVAPSLLPWLCMLGTVPPLEKFDLDTMDVFVVRDCPSNIESSYRELTGDIAVPPKKSIILS